MERPTTSSTSPIRSRVALHIVIGRNATMMKTKRPSIQRRDARSSRDSCGRAARTSTIEQKIAVRKKKPPIQRPVSADGQGSRTTP